MEYLLVLAIEFKKYKKPARLTIHTGDNFIDTFDLDRDYSCATNHITSEISQRFYDEFEFGGHTEAWARWLNERTTNISRLWKVYKLNGNTLQDKLTIKVENDNNDYTNGFMRNTSLIKFKLVALVREDLVENNAEKLVKALIKFRKGRHLRKIRLGIKDLLGTLPPLEEGYQRPSWPYVESFRVCRADKNHNADDVKNNHWWLGGSFTAEFQIRSKHRTKYLGTPGHHTEMGFPIGKMASHDFCLTFYKPLLNIYDEDQ